MSNIVMAGLDPAIHVLAQGKEGVDARHKAGHDGRGVFPFHRTSTFLNCQGSLSSISSGNRPG
ncbi:MAG: hypothetical protein WB768_05140, partial [Bradyrhizobium sp.]